MQIPDHHRLNTSLGLAIDSMAPSPPPLSFALPPHSSLPRPSPPFPLELLPLRPSPHRASSSLPVNAPQSFFWRPGASPQPVRGSFDINQLPPGGDCEDAAESSPTGVFSPFPSDSMGRTAADNGRLIVKREREKSSDQEQDRMCEVSSRGSDEDEAGGTRKKLRLSKDQSALLEESFKEHSTLNPKQKNALAKQLNLRPRQVEVWFQNRRARTKLKQTEVDCELLKRCCESLTEENRRLQKELQELRAIKAAPPCVIAHDFYMPLPAATLTMCPSCERLATTVDNRSFSKPQPHQFSQPSAAC